MRCFAFLCGFLTVSSFLLRLQHWHLSHKILLCFPFFMKSGSYRFLHGSVVSVWSVCMCPHSRSVLSPRVWLALTTPLGCTFMTEMFSGLDSCVDCGLFLPDDLKQLTPPRRLPRLLSVRSMCSWGCCHLWPTSCSPIVGFGSSSNGRLRYAACPHHHYPPQPHNPPTPSPARLRLPDHPLLPVYQPTTLAAPQNKAPSRDAALVANQ